MRVAALFRYPVKGFTRQECASLHVLPGGRVAGDRVLGLRFHDATTADDAWGTKHQFAALVNTPGLTALRVELDHATLQLRATLAGDVLFDGVLDSDGRRRLASTVEQYILGLDDNPLSAHPHRLPLRVVGDAMTSRYQDREPGFTTLHGRGSLVAMAAAVDETPPLTERRFRSNVAVDGVDPWEEQRWVGRKLQIGDVAFEAAGPVTRCLGTHANPVTGQRDRSMMTVLLDVFPAERPTFGILMTSEHGGTIRVGDGVEASD